MRLIAILRDPVARAFSHYRMMRLRGEESRSFEAAVEELLRPERLREVRRAPTPTSAYVAWGEYGRILAGYRELFPAEQLKVVYTAELEADPAAVLVTLHEHLGVATDFVPENLEQRYRVGAGEQRMRRLSPEALRGRARRSAGLRRAWGGLPEGARHSVYNGFEKVTYRFDLWNRRGAGAEPTGPAPETAARLRDHFAADAAVLTDPLGAPPPW